MTAEYLANLRREGRYSVTTLVIIEGWLKRLQAWSGDRNLLSLRPKELRDWRQGLAWNPGPSGKLYSEHTQNQAVYAVRGFYRWCFSEGLVSYDPATELETRVVARGTKPEPSTAEKRKLLATPNLDTPLGMRDRAILGLLLETKISRPACAALELSHLDLETGAIMAGGRRGGVLSISDGLGADLERYLREGRPLLVRLEEPSSKLFLNRFGRPLTVLVVAALVRAAHERARSK